MMTALGHAYDDGAFARFDDFRDPEGFRALMARVARLAWVVYAKAPFKKGQHVLAYLGRYTHRVGIANSRLLAVSDRAVTFRTKGHGTETLSPVEFLQRLVQHVLPDGLHKIRHAGLYASASKARREDARGRLGQVPPTLRTAGWRERLARLTGRDIGRCPHCGGPLFSIPVARCRDPPTLAA